MQVTLIRHSQTAGNAARRYIGRTDEALSEEGIRLAQDAGAAPQVSRVYVSPLGRARHTAAILFPNAEQAVVDGLREMDFGDFEGRSFSDMAHNPAYRAWVEGSCLGPCPNGESREAFSRRVCKAFGEVLAESARRGEDGLYFVVHGGTIMAIMERFALPKQDYYAWSVKNCQGYRCQVNPGPITLTVLDAWRTNRENTV